MRVAGWRQLWGRLFSGDPDTDVLVRAMATVALAMVLLTVRPGSAPVPVRIAFGVAAALWLVFALFDLTMPRVSMAALVASSVIASGTIGFDRDNTAIALTCIALGAFTVRLTPRIRIVLAVTVLVLVAVLVSCLAARRGTTEILVNQGVVVLIVLLGFNRRQYRLRVRQTEQLLAQTRQAQQDRARAAALDERARIAREMHDVLAHSLGALSVQLEVAEALLADRSDVEGALHRVRRARRLAVEGLTEARGAVAALRTDVPALPEALAQLVEAHRRDHDVGVDFHTEGAQRPLSTAATVSLLRTAREALTNAAKHATGSPITMRLTYRPETVELLVDNRIAGTPSADDRPGGYGLTGMAERIALMGGRLSAGRSASGQGWQVTAEVPE